MIIEIGIVFLVMRTFRISLFLCWNIPYNSCHVVHYIPSTYLPHIWKFVFTFDTFIQFPIPPTLFLKTHHNSHANSRIYFATVLPTFLDYILPFRSLTAAAWHLQAFQCVLLFPSIWLWEILEDEGNKGSTNPMTLPIAPPTSVLYLMLFPSPYFRLLKSPSSVKF